MKVAFNKRAIIFISLCITILCLLTGCGKDEVVEDNPVYVKTQKAGSSTQSTDDSYSGTVKGRYESNLAFQVSGKIISRNVNVGDKVVAGDVLMVIDDKDIKQNVNVYNAQVEAARSKMNLAQSDLARYKQLYTVNAISAQTLDQYQNAYDSALAAYNQAIAQAEQGYNSLGYTQLIADKSGVISSTSGEAGQVVSAGQTVAVLVQDGEREIEIAIPENKIQTISIGQEAEVNFWALNNTVVRGIVREISPIADSVARTYNARITLVDMPDNIQLGMTANVVFATNNTSLGTTLPLSALYQIGNKAQVWIVNSDSKLELRDVTIESIGKNDVVVSGLNKDEVVVISGVHKLYEGESVKLLDGDAL